MKQGEICTRHGEYHCLDCGYHWYSVNDSGEWVHVPGTGGEVSWPGFEQ